MRHLLFIIQYQMLEPKYRQIELDVLRLKSTQPFCHNLDTDQLFPYYQFCCQLCCVCVTYGPCYLWSVLPMVRATYGPCYLWSVLPMVRVTWSVLPVGCVTYGLCYLWAVLPMIHVTYGLCYLWAVLPMGCVTYDSQSESIQSDCLISSSQIYCHLNSH